MENLLDQIQQQNPTSIPLWVWGLVVLIVIIVAVVWTLREEDKAEAVAVEKPVVEAKAPDAPQVRPDNLKRVNGIGPKIEKLLKDNGITTFAQLAQTEVSRIQALLDTAEYTLADPATWPEQARQLAAGKS